MNHIESFECLPRFEIYWEPPWGGMVTIRLLSTYRQYEFLTGLCQEVSNFMKKHSLLTIKTDILLSNEEDQGLRPNLPPFDIIALDVPKNFLRKLVGFQDKHLNNYKKRFQVDFDYQRDLLVDEVFYMNESTILRIFGRG